MKFLPQSVIKAIRPIANKVEEHMPQILTGVGIGSMLSSTYLAVKATPKAQVKLEEAKWEKRGELTLIEKVKVAGKDYIPSAVTAGFGVGCLIGSNRISAGRAAMWSSAYEITKETLKEYKEKTKEVVGEEKAKEIDDAIAEDNFKQNPPVHTVFLGEGKYLFYDPYSGRFFHSTRSEVMEAVNKVNYEMMTDLTGYASLNDLYFAIPTPELEPNDSGNALGWHIQKELIKVNLERTDTNPNINGGAPYIVLDFYAEPTEDYRRW